MSVPLTGAGGYFTRQGAIIGEYNRVAALYGSTLDTGFQSIWVQFASSDQAAVQNLPTAVATYRNSGQQYQATLVQAGQTASILQVSDDTTVVPETMQQSITVLIGQMVAASQTIQRATLGQTVTPWASNLGDATVVIGTNNQYGVPLDMIFTESIVGTCTDSSTAYGETLQFVGPPSVPPVGPYWPSGSGTNTTMTITDPANTTLITDGMFVDWTGSGNNTPVNWDIINGAAGTTVFQGTGGVRASNPTTAKITSDGAQATQLAQAVSLSINTVYCFSVQAKVSASDGSGIFRMALTDADGNVLTDDDGNDLSYTRNMSAQITTSWQCFTAFFSTPRQLPATVNIQYGFSVAPTAAKYLLLDLAAGVAATQLYTGGVYAAAFSGADATALGDYYTAAITNSLTSQSFARGMDRLYGMRSMGVAFPSADSPTISDSLVTH